MTGDFLFNLENTRTARAIERESLFKSKRASFILSMGHNLYFIIKCFASSTKQKLMYKNLSCGSVFCKRILLFFLKEGYQFELFFTLSKGMYTTWQVWIVDFENMDYYTHTRKYTGSWEIAPEINVGIQIVIVFCVLPDASIFFLTIYYTDLHGIISYVYVSLYLKQTADTQHVNSACDWRAFSIIYSSRCTRGDWPILYISLVCSYVNVQVDPYAYVNVVEHTTTHAAVYNKLHRFYENVKINDCSLQPRRAVLRTKFCHQAKLL